MYPTLRPLVSGGNVGTNPRFPISGAPRHLQPRIHLSDLAPQLSHCFPSELDARATSVLCGCGCGWFCLPAGLDHQACMCAQGLLQPHSLDSSRLLHPSNISSRESMGGVDFRAAVGRPACCGWRISGPLPFASKVTWCMWCFQVRREGAAGMEGGKEGGVESGSQRMCELIPEIPSGLAQLPSFQGQLP